MPLTAASAAGLLIAQREGSTPAPLRVAKMMSPEGRCVTATSPEAPMPPRAGPFPDPERTRVRELGDVRAVHVRFPERQADGSGRRRHSDGATAVQAGDVDRAGRPRSRADRSSRADLGGRCSRIRGRACRSRSITALLHRRGDDAAPTPCRSDDAAALVRAVAGRRLAALLPPSQPG